MLKSNLIANYLGQGWAALMGLAFIPLYIRCLGVEAYGLIGVFALLQVSLSLLDMGLTPTIGREMARFTGGTHSNQSIRDLLRTTEVIAAVIAILIAATVAFGAKWIATSWLKADTLPASTVTQAFVIMGLVIALRFLEGIYRSVIVGLQQQVLFNIVSGVMATFRWGGAAGILLWVSPTIEAFFLWQCIASFVALGILCFITYSSLHGGAHCGRFSIEAFSRVSGFLGGMVSINFFALLLMQVDKILLSRLLTLSEFGFYTLASTLAGALFMLIGPITQAFYPKFCELYARGDTVALRDGFHKSSQLVSVIAGSGAIVLMLFAQIFLEIWTQDAKLAEKVAPLLSILMLGNLLNGLMWVPYQMQLAHGWTSLTAKINVVAVVLIVPTILWVVPRHGAIGAAWVWVALNAGYCVVAVQIMHVRVMTSEKWHWYRWDVMSPLGGAFLLALTVKLITPKPQTLDLQIIILFTVSLLTLGVAILSASSTRQYMLEFLKLGWSRIASRHDG